MVKNKEAFNNLTAEAFFGGHKVAAPDKVNNKTFQDDLRDKVLQAYINYQEDPKMAESIPADGAHNTESPAQKLSFWKQKPAWIIGGILALAVVTIIGAVLLIPGVNSNKPNLLKAEVAYTEGKVLYRTAATAEWKTAQSDTVLEQGFAVKVEGNGRSILNLDDGSSLRLNSESTVTLTSLDPNHIVVTNDRGELYSRVMKAQRTFDVIANGITYRSLGTAYKTLCYDNEVSEDKVETATINGVEVYESKVQILGIDGSGNLVVEQGEKYFVVNLEAPELENKVTEVLVSDIQLDEFVMWNKEQDEKVQAFKTQMGILFDIKAPTLNVTSPMDGEETLLDSVLVTGTTDTDTTLTINGNATINNNGSFSYELALVDGPNGIKVIAEDTAGNKSVRNLTVVKKLAEEVDDNGNPTATATPKPTAAPTGTTSKITLTGTKVNDGVSFTWNVTGLDTSKGFKLVKSLNSNPVYPGNDYQYLTNGSQRNYTWNIKDGKTYHFRICQYDGNGVCLLYSNDITVQAPAPTTVPNKVTSISLSVNATTKKVSWTPNGYSESGYKVVWSKSPNPTYPTGSGTEYQYFGDASRRVSDTLSAFDGYGTYYVRVCAYNNGPEGECSPYSNQVTLNFVNPGTDNN